MLDSTKKNIINKFLNLSGIKQGETKLIGYSAGYAALIGFAQAWIKAIPMALFLTYYPVTFLPYVYILSAIVLVIIGICFTRVEKYFNIDQLTLNIFLILAGGFFVFWWLIYFSFSLWMYGLLVIWSQVATDILDLELWLILNRLFTLDQAKREFGLIGFCQPFAGFIGGLLIPVFLMFFVSSKEMILTIGLIISITFVLLKQMIDVYRQRFHSVTITNRLIEKTAELKTNWLGNSYVVNNMLFAIFSLFLFAVVDFTFFSETKYAFHDEVKLAGFFGLFFAALNIFDMICRGLIAKPLIEKMGVRSALLIRSVFVGIIALGLLFIWPITTHPYLLVLLCALMKIFDEGLSNSILRQAVLVLYQPFAPNIRAWLQNRIELFVIPAATLAAGVSIWLIKNYFNLGLNSVLILILVLCVFSIYFIYKKLYPGYIGSLVDALTLQLKVSPKLNYTDKNYINLLIDKIQNGDSYEVIYCLSLIESIGRDLFVKCLKSCLVRSESIIKRAALVKLQKIKEENLVGLVENIFHRDDDIFVRAEAFKALIFQKSNHAESEVIANLKSNGPLLDIAILSALNHSANYAIVQKAQQELQFLLDSSLAADRVRGVKILENLNYKYNPIAKLKILLNDSDIIVRSEAISASSKFRDDEIYELIANCLDENVAINQVAKRALIKIGDRCLPVLKQKLMLASKLNQVRKIFQVINVLAGIKSKKSIQILLGLLSDCNERAIKYRVIQALGVTEYHSQSYDNYQIINFIIDDEINYLQLLARMQKESTSQGYIDLATALLNKMKLSKKILLLLLKFIYPQEIMKTIIFHLHSESEDKMNYALELLENVLKPIHRNNLLYMIKKMLYKENKLVNESPAESSALETILMLPTHYISGLLKAYAIYTIVEFKLLKLMEAVNAHRNDSDFIVRETVDWAMGKLQ